MRYGQFFVRKRMTSGNASAKSILEAAETLFLERGYSAVTTRDIASKAGVNLGLIPYYFSSKENLARQVCFILWENSSAGIPYDLSPLSSAEYMHVESVLSWRVLNAHETYSKFYYELLEKTNILDSYGPSFIASSWQIIKDYNLNVSEEENAIYLAMMHAAENTLMSKFYKHEINITVADIVDLLTSNYFFNIGMPTEEIQKVITKSRAYCKKFENGPF